MCAMKILLTAVIVFLISSSLVLAQETISPEILRQLQELDGGYKSPCQKELLLYKKSFQASLKEIEIALGEQQCWSQQILLSGLIAEFDPNETSMDRILEMSQEIGYAIGSCENW